MKKKMMIQIIFKKETEKEKVEENNKLEEKINEINNIEQK